MAAGRGVLGYLGAILGPSAFVIVMVATNFFHGSDFGHIGEKRLPILHQSLFSEALMFCWMPVLVFVVLFGIYGLAAELFGRNPAGMETAGRGAAFVLRLRAIPLGLKLLLGAFIGALALPFLFPQVRRATSSTSLALRAVTVFVIPWLLLFITIGIPSMIDRRRDFLEHRSSYGE